MSVVSDHDIYNESFTNISLIHANIMKYLINQTYLYGITKIKSYSSHEHVKHIMKTFLQQFIDIQIDKKIINILINLKYIDINFDSLQASHSKNDLERYIITDKLVSEFYQDYRTYINVLTGQSVMYRN